MDEPSTIGGLDAPGRVGGAPATVAVCVVLVTDGVTPYLRQTLQALADQTVVPHSSVVVDVSREPVQDLPDLLAEIFPEGHRPALRHDAAARTFGQAVVGAVLDGDPTTWLWLLHDDSAPRPDALARLRTAVEIAPSVVVAGCKQVAWSDPARLLEVGVSTSRFGRRMTGLDENEVDQGQHDGREDVLAVGLAGALVRRDLWDELGGPDPALGPYGDGLDLSRRARLAGHRVVVVPDAVVLHAQASLGLDGHRREGWDAGRSTLARREAYLRSQLVGAPLALVPVVVLLSLLSGVGRAVVRLVLKEPRLVPAELLAPLAVLGRPDRLVAARATARRTRVVRRGTLRPLEVTWRSVVREQRDRRLAAAASRRSQAAPSELELRELAALRDRRRAGLVLVLLGALVLTAVTVGLTAWRTLAGRRLSGGALSTAVSSVGELWAALGSWWVPGGLGHPAPGDPFLAVLLPVTALLGDSGRAGAVLVAGGIVLAAAGGWFAAGAVTRSIAVRTWAAVAWTASPALLLAVSEARVGAVVAHAGLPWVALGAARAIGVARVDAVESGLVGARREGEEETEVVRPAPARTAEPSVAAAAGAALAFAAVTAGAPVLLPAGLLVLALVAAWRRARVLWIGVPALVLHGPTLVAAAGGDWRGLLADPGTALAALAPPAWEQALGWPSAGSAAAWFTALAGSGAAETWPALAYLATGVVALVALLALTRRPPAVRAVRLGWVIAGIGLVAAALVARVPVAVATEPGPADGAGVEVLSAAWSGPGVSLALLGLLLAAVLGAAGARPALARTAFGWRQVTAGVVVLAVWAGPAAVLAGWVAAVRTEGTVLVLSDRETVPAAGVQLQTSPDQSRVLLLIPAADGSVGAELLRADGVPPEDLARLVTAHEVVGDVLDGRVAEPDAATTELAAAAASLAVGVGDGADAAAALGIGGVLVAEADPDAAVDTDVAVRDLVAVLDATPGLERVTQTVAGTFWRVGDGRTVSWARLTEPGEGADVLAALPSADRTVETEITPSDAARQVVLAERADPGWRAWLDGRPLRSVATSWRQAFDLPAEGGTLVVAYRPPGRDGWILAQLAVLVTTLLLAVPVRRRRF